MHDIEEILDAVPNQGMRGAVERYLLHGISPGGFLTAVLSNDLKGAAARADTTNRQLLFEWADWVYNYCPGGAQGSEFRVNTWISQGGLVRPAVIGRPESASDDPD
jgi:hypothetical protein